ncbi:MAG: dihydrolipoamide acyltransferase [Acidimicrobiia bacterium]|nr:dihydrolipoamide acyltransferase [bacterium]MXZ30703.1 dihydrolipoamide acyltransferase [Acidimicrobiia bacterium]MYB23545.1 dihydrolipoamide acyltransferase [Acidimicrobiia bacterium]MYJ13509.1 dihydrolipoamide acyltransferase [Acidimicrobiia bacterium]
MLELILPKTGIYEGDVTLIEWLVAEGGEVAIGDPLFLMESEKIEMEIESDTDGWLHREAEAGLEAPIGTRIGAIAETPDERAALCGN